MVYHRLTPDNDFNLTDAVLEDLDGRLEMAFFARPIIPPGSLLRADSWSAFWSDARAGGYGWW